LVLAGGYDLIVSLRPNNVFMHYEIIQAVMLADLHSYKLVMIVSLKTMNVQFILYRVAVLPVRLFNNTFVQFEVVKDDFGIDILQRRYLTNGNGFSEMSWESHSHLSGRPCRIQRRN
jgi:hypothetical protein